MKIKSRTILFYSLFTVTLGCSLLTNNGKIHLITGDQARKNAEHLSVVKGGPAVGVRDARLEPFALFNGLAMPTGVAVSKAGRIFLSFPRWGDNVINTLVELRGEELVAFPDSLTNSFNSRNATEFDVKQHLVNVQSVVMDEQDRLWVLDSGSLNLAPTLMGAPKLLAYDLNSGLKVKTILFPSDVAMKLTYLNDVRIDLTKGKDGIAYITDSGVGGLIIVDIYTGESWRQLDNDDSVKSTPGLQQNSEGQPFVIKKASGEQSHPDFRVDGIALDSSTGTLYYTPLTSRNIYSVPTNILTNSNANPITVKASVKKVASKQSGNDGILYDGNGFLYTTDFEDNSIKRLNIKSGEIELVVRDERLIWPDSLAINGKYLYIVSNQLARQPNYHYGVDNRKPPYALFRLKLNN